GRPTWYVGSDVRITGIAFDACGTRAFSGRLYAMAGAPFGTPVAAAMPRDAGRIIGSDFIVDRCSPDLTVDVEIDGRTVRRQLVRQTWAMPRIDGVFRGAYVPTTGDNTCLATDIHGRIEISAEGIETVIRLEDDRDPARPTCTWRGTY